MRQHVHSPIDRILIIHTCGIGDMIMFTPALEMIRNAYPNAEIDFLIVQKPAALPIVHRDDLHHFFTVPNRFIALLKMAIHLRHKRYDVSLVTSSGRPWKASLFSFLIGAKNRIGEYHTKPPRFLYTSPVHYQPHLHRVECDILLVQALIGDKTVDIPTQPTFTLLPQHHEQAEAILAEHNLANKTCFGIHPGASKTFLSKRWPKEYYAELINCMKISYPDMQAIVFGSVDETEEIEYITMHSPAIHIPHLALDTTAALIARMNLFICNDSGLGHIASCFPSVFVVSLFGSTKENMARPWTKTGQVIRSNTCTCPPCSENNEQAPPECPRDCMISLTVNSVLSQITEDFLAGRIQNTRTAPLSTTNHDENV